tara:strand:+ start:11853 stop:12503 length:651 start_codon:yes stop_codon:yes gene_type:complete
MSADEDKKRKHDAEDVEDAGAPAAAGEGAAGEGAAASGAAGAAGAAGATTKKQKTAAALTAAATTGISPKVNYGPDEEEYEQQQAYEDARDSFKIRAGKLLKRFEDVMPHVENLSAHLQVYASNLGESESLDKSFKVLRKFFRRGKDDTAHGQHELDIMYLLSFTPLGFAIVNGESHQDEPWAPAIRQMHRSRIEAAKARIEKWDAAEAAEGAAGE